MEIKIEGDPGTGNSFAEIKITDGGIYQHLPNVTTVNNTTNIYSNGKKGEPAPAGKGEKQVVKDAVLAYVGKLKEYVKPEWADKYDSLWVRILSLKEVEENIYDIGSQKGHEFNRDFVGNIICVLINKVYGTDNRTKMCLALEGKECNIRKTMSQDPSEDVKKAVMKLLAEN